MLRRRSTPLIFPRAELPPCSNTLLLPVVMELSLISCVVVKSLERCDRQPCQNGWVTRPDQPILKQMKKRLKLHLLITTQSKSAKYRLMLNIYYRLETGDPIDSKVHTTALVTPVWEHWFEGRNVLFNDALNTFYLLV